MRGDDKTLAARIAGGDRQAFTEMYQLTYGKVFRYILRLVGSEAMAEDVVVQTYTVVWQKAADFKGQGRLTTWIIGIARNLAFREFRRAGTTTPFDEAYIQADTESWKEAEKRNVRDQMKSALHQLSAKHREILELVFFQGRTYQEIAEIVGIPVNTVKTRVFHAKKALKDELIKRNITADDI